MVGLPAHRGRTIGFCCVALGAAVMLAAGTAQARPSLDGERLDQLDRYEVLSFSDAYKNGIDRGKAIGVIDATSDEVFRVVTDFARYKEFVPRISESSLTARTDDGAQVALTADLPWPAGRSWIEADYHFEHLAGDIYRARFEMRRGSMRQYLGSVYIEPWTNGRGKAQTAITYEFTAEPGIYAPKSLLNKSLRRSAASFVHALRQRINELHRVGLLHPNAPALASATKPANIIRPAPSTLKAHR
jgi:ribosome-associated toxin RatA of RatAB toxin-antitoxin module